MAKYFVHENRHYPGPGAPTQFEVRQYGVVDATIEFCATREQADARCSALTEEAETAQARNHVSQKRASGEERLFVRPNLINGAHVRKWPSGK